MNYNVYICISIYNGFTSNRSMAPRWMPSSSASMEPPKASSWPPSRCWITWRSKRRWDRGPHGFTQHQKIVTFPAVKIGIWLKIGSQNGVWHVNMEKTWDYIDLPYSANWDSMNHGDLSPKWRRDETKHCFFVSPRCCFEGLRWIQSASQKYENFNVFFPMLQHMFDDCFPMLFRVFKHFV